MQGLTAGKRATRGGERARVTEEIIFVEFLLSFVITYFSASKRKCKIEII